MKIKRTGNGFKKAVTNVNLAFEMRHKTLKFRKYKDWCLYVENLNNTLNDKLKFTDIEKTKTATYSAMNSVPTEIVEPIFEDIFGIRAPIRSTSQLKIESIRLRDSANQIITQLQPTINLSKFPTQLLFDILDRQLNLKDKRFKTVSVEEAVSYLPQNTSSSFDRYRKKSDNRNHCINQLSYIRSSGDTDWMSFPAVVRWRTQQRLSGSKLRQFFMFGHLALSLEAVYFKPFLEHFRNNPMTCYCYGNKFPEISKRISKIKQNFKYAYCFDFESFDQNVRAYLIHFFFKYVRTHLSFSSRIEEKLFWSLGKYSESCSVATSDKGIPSLVYKSQGVMSGKLTTNFEDTVIGLIYMNLMSIEFGLPEFTTESLSQMGDDSMFGSNEDLNLVEISSFLKKQTGAILTTEKSFKYELKKDSLVYFLGYNMNENGRYANFDLFKRQLLYSETFIPESVLSTKTRLFSKLASICFKCTDGYKFFDEYAPKLAFLLKCKIPITFVEIYSVTGEPIDYSQEKSISEFKTTGWMRQ